MVKKKRLWYEDEDNIDNIVQRDIDLTDEYDLMDVTFPNKTNGKEPNSRMDQGRNCPNCGGRLFHKGPLVDSEEILLRCRRCGREFFAADIDVEKDIVDTLYRTIPLSVQNKWNEHRRKYRRGG